MKMLKEMKSKKNFKLLDINTNKWIIAILTSLIFVVIFAIDGVVVEKDTAGYLNMSPAREAGYSLFLKVLSILFGSHFMVMAVTLQMILSVTAICLLTFTVQKLWKLNTFSLYVIWGVQFVFLLLCRFGSGQQAVYASMVLTEGLTYAIYALYFKSILQLNHEFKVARLCEILLYCGLLAFIRTQLMVACMGLLALMFFKVIFKQASWKQGLIVLAGGLLTIVAVSGGQKMYIHALYGVDSGIIGSNSFLLTSGLYGADEKDAELFEDAEEKTIFQQLYTLAMEREANYQYAPESGFLNQTEYYIWHFDILKFEIISPWFTEYLNDKGVTNGVQIELIIDEYAKKIGMPLFLDNLSQKLSVMGQGCMQGYMRTIAKSSLILLPFVILAYVIYIALIILCFRDKKDKSVAWAGLFVFLMITGNILVTAFMIFCEPRYILYNMVPFYIMGYVMLTKVYEGIKEKRKDDSGIVPDNME